MIRIKPLANLFFWLMLASGCGGDERGRTSSVEKAFPAADPELAKAGRDIFYDRGFGGTGVSCADCHPDCDDAVPLENRITPGHSIVGAAGRSSVWNGLIRGADLRRTAAGASRCAAVFQKRGNGPEQALTKEEAARLLAFY